MREKFQQIDSFVVLESLKLEFLIRRIDDYALAYFLANPVCHHEFIFIDSLLMASNSYSPVQESLVDGMMQPN
jgi:hypothetical protein